MSDPTKLSYDPANIPQPVTTQDVYMHANLVEQRLIRKALTRIADALEARNTPVASTVQINIPEGMDTTAMQAAVTKAAKAK